LPARARAVRALGAGTSPNSLAMARAGYLAEIGLLHDARLTVLAALARDPDEPVLHTLLGTLYTQTGLPRQASAAFDAAQSLMTRGTK
jgi:lipoprotein NlpI